MEFLSHGVLFAASQFMAWVANRLLGIDPNLRVLEQSRSGFTRFTTFGLEAKHMVVQSLIPGIVYVGGQALFGVSAPLWATFVVGLLLAAFYVGIVRPLPMLDPGIENGTKSGHPVCVFLLTIVFYANLPLVFLLPLLANQLHPQ